MWSYSNSTTHTLSHTHTHTHTQAHTAWVKVDSESRRWSIPAPPSWISQLSKRASFKLAERFSFFKMLKMSEEALNRFFKELAKLLITWWSLLLGILNINYWVLRTSSAMIGELEDLWVIFLFFSIFLQWAPRFITSENKISFLIPLCWIPLWTDSTQKNCLGQLCCLAN